MQTVREKIARGDVVVLHLQQDPSDIAKVVPLEDVQDFVKVFQRAGTHDILQVDLQASLDSLRLHGVRHELSNHITLVRAVEQLRLHCAIDTSCFRLGVAGHFRFILLNGHV